MTEKINMREITPGKAVLVTPGTKQGYGGLEAEYVEDSICFFGPLADRMKAAGIIEDGVFELGSLRKLLPIIQLARIPAVNSQFKANMMLQELLLDMYLTCTEDKTKNDSSERIKQILDVLHKDPYKWWTVNELAELTELSLPQFRRLFHKETGISPKMYIMQLKMKNSGEDLLQRDMSINQIARKYGFKDSYHFSSFFKKQTGLSPTNYRLLNT
jgi:AraC-like DNA-binding protein